MFEIVFAILTVIYIIIAVKVDQWITISALGFKSETPAAFLRSPGIYNVVRSVFFIAAASSTFLIKTFPCYIGLLVLLVIWFCARLLGRRLAFKRFRCIMSEMVDRAETEKEKAEYINKARRSNQELQEEVSLNMSPCAFILFTIAFIIFSSIGIEISTEAYNATGNIESTLGALFGGVIIWPLLAYLLVFLEVSLRKKLRPKRDLIFARVMFIFSILLLANFILQYYAKSQILEIYSGIEKHEDVGPDQSSQLAQLSQSNYKRSQSLLHHGIEYMESSPTSIENRDFQKAFDYYFAKDYIEKAIEVDPTNSDAYCALGSLYLKQGKYQEALEAYKQAIRIEPDNDYAHYMLGSYFYNRGRYQDAIDAYKQSIFIKPLNADAYIQLGHSYSKLSLQQESKESYKQAIEVCKQVIRIKPEEEHSHYQLGKTYELLGFYKESIDSYNLALRINPDYAPAHYGLGRIYLLLNDKNSALEEYKILKKLDVELANDLFNMIYSK